MLRLTATIVILKSQLPKEPLGKTYTSLLTHDYSFVPFSYKLGLVRTLVDRIFKINNTRAGFHLDINNFTKMLRKNLFLALSRMLLEIS